MDYEANGQKITVSKLHSAAELSNMHVLLHVCRVTNMSVTFTQLLVIG